MLKINIVIAIVITTTIACQLKPEGDVESLALLERALKEGGGAPKISEYSAVSFSAKFKEGKTQVYVNGLITRSRSFRLELTTDTGVSYLMVGNRDFLWVQEKGKVADEIPKGNDPRQRFEMCNCFIYGAGLPDLLIELKSKGYNLRCEGEADVGGVATLVLAVKHKQYPDARLYFENKSGLPIKSKISLPGDTGETIEFYFGNFEVVDGVKHFTKLRVMTGETSVEYELRDLKLLKTVDDKQFKKPN